MPVFGHAFVGLGTAIQWEPKTGRDGRPLPALAAACWIPVVVVVSYLPDIVTQIGSMTGLSRAGLIGHSFTVGAAAGAVTALIWARAIGASRIHLLIVTIGTILGHDVLDILQASDRAPFWPWSTRIVSVGTVLPGRSLSEGVMFLLLFGFFAVWRVRSGRTLGSLAGHPPLSQRVAWVPRGAIVAVVLVAVVVHSIRSGRERQANLAGRLLGEGRYAEALAAAATADRWPWPARPGRIDLIRGEAHEALGQPAIAEGYFLRAYREDPTNFWAVADLAEFYAAGPAPSAERRRRVQPYADELRERFPRHERLADVLARVDRRLKT
jgi:membrane-bound metal-dependent hydrolase YbcI (DUF457 family)